PKRVFSKQTSFLMLDMMRDVLKRGTGKRILPQLKFRTDWAGKTGTSNEYRDEWFVGTNPNVTLGVWTGYTRYFEHYQRSYGPIAHRTMDLWAAYANTAYDIHPDLLSPNED